jgi:transcriptional regulator with XRE-family HTH domain
MGTEEAASSGAPATTALRKAITDSGLALREITRRSGVDVGVISRFMKGTRTPTLKTADRIIEALGLDVELKPRETKQNR